MNDIARARIKEAWENGDETHAVVLAFLGDDYSGQHVLKVLKEAGLEVTPIGYAAALSAGVCQFRGGNEHGNAMCLATGQLIETMQAHHERHGTNCRSRIGQACNCK